MFDWQSAAVLLIVMAALVYAGRRTWSSLRSFTPGQNHTAIPESGCGNCEANQMRRGSSPPPPVKVLVQIKRSHPPAR